MRALLDRAGNRRSGRNRRRHRSAATSAAWSRPALGSIVAGAAIFHAPDPERATRELKAAALAAALAAVALLPMTRTLAGGRRRPRDVHPRARALRRNRQDGRGLLRELLVWFEVGRTDLLRAAGWSYGRWKRTVCAAGHRGALRIPAIGAVQRRARDPDARHRAVAGARAIRL